MNVKISLGLTIGSLLLIAPSARALDFTFSFSNVTGNASGTVTGLIQGLTDNTNNQTAQHIIIQTYPASLGTPNDGLDAALWGNPNSAPNVFSVAGGKITSANFDAVAVSQNSELSISCTVPKCGSTNYLTFDGGTNYVEDNNGFGGVTFSPAATSVPFEFSPIPGIALGLPLFIGLRMWKTRNRKGR